MAVQNIAILGSTGSIGINTLKVIDRFPDKFRVIALTAYNNIHLLEQQVRKYSPRFVAVSQKGIAHLKKQVSSRKTAIFDVDQDIAALVEAPAVDTVVLGMRGSAALFPFLSAVRCGKRVAPANKEALVIAGDIIMAAAKKYKATVIPIDSEQSAIFQCLAGQSGNQLKKIYLTASGGPLREKPKSTFDRLSVAQILNHPRWKMGKKITVDSATLMNKGFEVIEAKRLFDIDVGNIEVLIHPEAIIHSMVAFKDGSILAQLGVTDMRLPIQYALTYPQRYDTGLAPVDFYKLGKLTFSRPDTKKFPALSLAFYAAEMGGTLPCVMNAADEEAVEAFLSGRLRFLKIYDVVEKVVLKHRVIKSPALDDILKTDLWARQEARRIIFN